MTMKKARRMKTVPQLTFAIPTPFLETGQVDVAGIGRMVKWLVGHGVTSIIPGGTTGEFAGMTAAERLQVLVATREALGPAGFVFANVTSCALDDALERAHEATACGAADALLILPPFYHAPVSAEANARGVESFFRQFLSRLPAEAPPVLLYTFAAHTQRPIPVDVYGRLCAEFPGRLVGIKASAVSLDEAMAYEAAAPGTFVLLGNGRANLPALRAGLRSVSGDCVAVCWALVAMMDFVDAGFDAAAEAAQQALVEIWRAEMEKHDEVPAVKARFAQIAEVATRDDVRPPLVVVDDWAAHGLAEAASRLRAAFDAIVTEGGGM